MASQLEMPVHGCMHAQTTDVWTAQKHNASSSIYRLGAGTEINKMVSGIKTTADKKLTVRVLCCVCSKIQQRQCSNT